MSKALLLEALGKIDSAVMTPEMTKQISEAFDSAVETQANAKVKTLQESIEKATEEYMKTIVESHIVDLKESFEKAVIAKSSALSEKYLADLTLESEEKNATALKEIQESVEGYLQYAVDQFVEENKATWNKEVDVAKAAAIMESAVEFATKFGIQLDEITKTEDQAKIALDESVGEVNRLKQEVNSMKKEKLFVESTGDLTAPQKDKLFQLLEGVESFDKYAEKLTLFKTTLIESIVPPKQEKKDEKSIKRSWEK
jgi:hypothetical protein